MLVYQMYCSIRHPVFDTLPSVLSGPLRRMCIGEDSVGKGDRMFAVEYMISPIDVFDRGLVALVGSLCERTHLVEHGFIHRVCTGALGMPLDRYVYPKSEGRSDLAFVRMRCGFRHTSGLVPLLV